MSPGCWSPEEDGAVSLGRLPSVLGAALRMGAWKGAALCSVSAGVQWGTYSMRVLSPQEQGADSEGCCFHIGF